MLGNACGMCPKSIGTNLYPVKGLSAGGTDLCHDTTLSNH